MEERIKKVLEQLTLEEKAALTSGISFWDTTPIQRLGVPRTTMSDGPHGVRKEVSNPVVGNIFGNSVPATCFPPAVTLASTWDRNLVFKVGEALAEECLTQGVDTLLGPGANIKRHPMGGRNFEYFSEDPYLSGELGVEYVNGVQSKGVGTSLKHFAVNSQEYRRLVASSEIDERTLREIYLSAFETIVKRAQPSTIMCSYNPINGIHASDNKRLLTDILRKEWGYKGIVVSDWGAVNDKLKCVEAGMDLEMPHCDGIRDRQLVQAINDGKMPFAPLDKSVERILRYVFRAEENRQKYKSFKADYEEHHHLARKAAASGAVLMKNEGGILPLSSSTSFAVVGELAKKIRSQGSGSSKLNPINEVSFTQYLKKREIDFSYSAGYNVNTDTAEESKFDRAVNATKDKDVVIAFVGLTEAYESESFDRTHINLPDSHNKMIDKLCANHSNVIVVLVGGSPVAMPWLNKVSAVLNVYLTGEAGGEATYDLLFGKKNPSGHLAETYPLSIEDVPSTPYFCKEVVPYCESIYVGYRYFDTAKKDVLFPFGYGLSYTKFEYSNIKLSSNKIGDNDKLVVSFEVENVGAVNGEVVPQLYVKDTQSTIFMPEKQLKGFDKFMLKAGEKRKVKLELNKRSFAYYNTEVCDFVVEAGEFEILVGEHSRDIRLTATVTYKASEQPIPDYTVKAPSYYNLTENSTFGTAEFETLLGRKVPVYHRPHKGQYNFNTVVGELDATWFAKLFRWIFKQSSLSMIPKNASTATKKMTQRGAMDMPIRNFYAMSGGTVSYEASTALLEAFNGKVVRGLFFTVVYLLKRSFTSKESLYKEKSNAKDKVDSSNK